MAVPNLKIDLYQARPWRFRLVVDGIELTDRVVRMELRGNPSDATIAAEATWTPVDATTGFLALSAEQTAALGAPGIGGKFWHDLFIDDLPCWKGIAVVEGRITR